MQAKGQINMGRGGIMLKVSKGFEESCNQRFAQKEKVYGGNDNPKNYRNMSEEELKRRVINQAHILAETNDIKKLKRELVDTANLCELTWRKLR